MSGVEAGETISSEVTSLLQNCKLYGRNKAHQRMLDDAQAVLSTDPDHCDALSYAGLALYRLGRHREALEALDKALKVPGAKESPHRQAVRRIRIACKNKSPDDVPDFFGFPRTAHLHDAGGSAVTRDDLLMSKDDRNYFCGSGRELIVEEKVDGANLGISIDSSHNILFQNRSHYVHRLSHAQFSGLERWKEDHQAALHARLQRNRHILFGEWCAAKHSLDYSQLPNLFLAFDVYDRQEERFFSRAELHRFLRGSGIPVVPVIAQKTFASVQELVPLLDTVSRFRSGGGFVEGIYIRAEGGSGEAVRRCKIVRADFIQGITKHWMGMQMVKNNVDAERGAAYAAECYSQGAEEDGADAHTCSTTLEDASARAQGGETPDAGDEAAATGSGQEKYPSTPHLSFSPGVNIDDVQLSASATMGFEGREIVITEKLDGGNCCIKGGLVYARTHSSPASHASFSPIKQLAQQWTGCIPEGYELFGENMTGIHSITYGHLGSYFYLFAVRSGGVWLPWDAVQDLADEIGVPTVPVVYRGQARPTDTLQGDISRWMSQPSALCSRATPEGFVVRLVEGFSDAQFDRSIAKYVRANHVQTTADWRRTWKKASLNPREGAS